MRGSFTGTSKGMTVRQAREVESAFLNWGVHLLSHGDCVGADEQADAIARGLGIMRVAWPGCDKWGKTPKRAFCEADVMMPPEPYLMRNRQIVDSGDVLIAAPVGMKEVQRSGTWATVRYARKQGKRIVLVMPDGTVGVEG